MSTTRPRLYSSRTCLQVRFTSFRRVRAPKIGSKCPCASISPVCLNHSVSTSWSPSAGSRAWNVVAYWPACTRLRTPIRTSCPRIDLTQSLTNTPVWSARKLSRSCPPCIRALSWTICRYALYSSRRDGANPGKWWTNDRCIANNKHQLPSPGV